MNLEGLTERRTMLYECFIIESRRMNKKRLRKKKLYKERVSIHRYSKNGRREKLCSIKDNIVSSNIEK